MTDNRMGGIALIAGSVAGIVTMSLHPTGHDLFAPGQLTPMTHLVIGVHALALVSLPVMFLGALALSRRLASPDRLAVAALVTYGFALVAVMIAAVASGLIVPGVARQIAAAEPAASEGLWILIHYTGQWNQACAQVFVVGSSAAIVLWSAAILRSGALARDVGIYGCLLGPSILIALFSGHLTLGVHGFGLVVLGQAIWYIVVGALLCRIPEA
jgi:hypothetical protein